MEQSVSQTHNSVLDVRNDIASARTASEIAHKGPQQDLRGLEDVVTNSTTDMNVQISNATHAVNNVQAYQATEFSKLARAGAQSRTLVASSHARTS